jgi:hypothetical protein
MSELNRSASAVGCLTRKAAELRKVVAGDSPSLLAQLLADRVVVCWLQVSFYDNLVAQTPETHLQGLAYSSNNTTAPTGAT